MTSVKTLEAQVKELCMLIDKLEALIQELRKKIDILMKMTPTPFPDETVWDIFQLDPIYYWPQEIYPTNQLYV
jgi:hypothetical protein